MTFANSVFVLHERGLLDKIVVHGDVTTTAAKQGGDNIGFGGHKHLKGDKLVAICDRHCRVLAPFVASPGNQNESPLLLPALGALPDIAKDVSIELRGSIVSFNGVYDSKVNRTAIFNRMVIPTSPRTAGPAKRPSVAESVGSTRTSVANDSARSSACSPGTTSFAGC